MIARIIGYFSDENGAEVGSKHAVAYVVLYEDLGARVNDKRNASRSYSFTWL